MVSRAISLLASSFVFHRFIDAQLCPSTINDKPALILHPSSLILFLHQCEPPTGCFGCRAPNCSARCSASGMAVRHGSLTGIFP